MQLLITCKIKGKGVSAADDSSDTRCILFWSCTFNKCRFQSCEARFPPRSPNMLINWGKYRRSREAWRHYIKTELLDFLLKTCCQMPIIRVPKAPLHFFSPHALQQTLLCERQECAVLAWSSLSMCFQRNFLVFLGYSHARRKEKQW